jgi:enterochelin esterase-like enzyme
MVFHICDYNRVRSDLASTLSECVRAGNNAPISMQRSGGLKRSFLSGHCASTFMNEIRYDYSEMRYDKTLIVPLMRGENLPPFSVKVRCTGFIHGFGGGLKRIMCTVLWLAGCTVISKPTELQTITVASPSTTTSPGVAEGRKTPFQSLATQSASVSASPTSTPGCQTRYGQVEQAVYSSAVLNVEVPFLIYLPACYGQTDRLYPTLYLLHGYPMDESQWVELGIEKLVDEGIAAGVWPPFIMVMPRQPEPLFTHTDGGSGSYEEEMVEVLVPHIDETYRTDARPQTRAVAGISRGGVWALEIALRNPEVFNSVAALSPSLSLNAARPPYDPFVIVRDGDRLPQNIFISTGDREPGFRVKIEAFNQALEEKGIDHLFVVGSGGHEVETWIAVMGDMLEFVIAGWLEDG